MDMFEEMKIYEPVMITSVEIAEAVPVGTVAYLHDGITAYSAIKRADGGGYWLAGDSDEDNEGMVGWTALLETNYRTLLEGFANYLEGGTQWMDDSPTEEELNLITAINVIREAIGYE